MANNDERESYFRFRNTTVVEGRRVPKIVAITLISVIIGGGSASLLDSPSHKDKSADAGLVSKELRECRESEDRLAQHAAKCDAYVSKVQPTLERIHAKRPEEIQDYPLPHEVPHNYIKDRAAGDY